MAVPGGRPAKLSHYPVSFSLADEADHDLLLRVIPPIPAIAKFGLDIGCCFANAGIFKGGNMPFDVFVSHSLKDKAIAEAVCSRLEAAKIRCWIAPRDIPAGVMALS